MEIRRVEPERIQPPAANPQGPRVDMDRHPSTPHQDAEDHHDTPDDAREEPPEETLRETQLTAYDSGGRVQQTDTAPTEGKNFDQRA